MWTGRRWLFVAIFVVFIGCVNFLGTEIFVHTAGSDPWAAAGRFFKAAFSPSLVDQNPTLPDDATPFLSRLGADLLRTVRYAVVATSLAIPAGFLLGFFASEQWFVKGRVRWVFQGLRWPVRVFLSLMRSIHELIWAIFFLAAFGDFAMSACLALALPFAGSLGKVFSELFDEQGAAAREVIVGAGGSSAQGFFGAVVPAALPDMISYSLFRFECVLRSSAVLGFLGVKTVGLAIMQSFDNLYYGEVWTALYALIATILIIEGAGHLIRKRLSKGVTRQKEVVGELTEKKLRKVAPRDFLLRGAGFVCLLIILAAFQLGARLTSPLAEGDREARLSRFLTKLTPDPVAPAKRVASWEERGEAWSAGSSEVLPWMMDIWKKPGAEALANTVAMSVAAVILAAGLALFLVPWAMRNLATGSPLGVDLGGGTLRRTLGAVIRVFFVLTRAVPEYFYAFILVGLLGPSAWPLIFALALHNLGILGRLWSEVGENEKVMASRPILGVGGSRFQVFLASVFPQSLNRFLLFFFYRWESCVREATVLGMLGVSSLGYYISLRKSFFEYDEVLLFSLMGAAVIILGDVLGDLLRRKLRG